jgi:hypothetical protein
MEIDKERREFLYQLADSIMSQIKRKGFTGFEYVDDETWEDAFTEVLYPLLDEAVAEYKLGSLDIFYIGYWFGRQ